MIEFQAWPKIPRLNRDITITEKIDGVNAAVGIVSRAECLGVWPRTDVCITDSQFLVYAQSRTRIITPEEDNKGFAKWVWNHAEELASILGPGLHFGEWWGNGIGRGYGLDQGDKRFSLFNTARWNDETLGKREGFLLTPVGLGVVPVLYEGPFTNGPYSETVYDPWNEALYDLATDGSKAVPGFNRPEGVVIYHHAANSCFKITLEHDDSPKEVVRQRALKDFRESEFIGVSAELLAP